MTTSGLVAAAITCPGIGGVQGVASVAVTVMGTVVVPPGPEAVTVKGVTPVGMLTGQLKVPEADAVVVHKVVFPGPVIATVLPGVAVPVIG